MEPGRKQAAWSGFAARGEAPKRRGKLRGIGMSYYLEVTANQPQEAADIRFTPAGCVIMAVRSRPPRPGPQTALAPIPRDPARISVPALRLLPRPFHPPTPRAPAPRAQTPD